MILINDITKVVKAEHIRASHQSKDLLIATISHELKTPLNSINGTLTLLEDHVPHEPAKEYLMVA